MLFIFISAVVALLTARFSAFALNIIHNNTKYLYEHPCMNSYSQ